MGRLYRVMFFGACCALAAVAQAPGGAEPREAAAEPNTPALSGPPASGADTTYPPGAYVAVVMLDGMVDEGMAVVVKRVVEENNDAAAIIFEVDTPGGRVDSAIEITDAILRAKPKTIAFVQGMGAISAGALISYSCDHIIMAGGTNIGASTPIIMGQDGPSVVDEKSMSFVRAKYRALGERQGHNPILGEAMVDPSIEVRGYKQDDGTWEFRKVQGGRTVETVEGGAPDRNKNREELPLPAGGIRELVEDILDEAERDRARRDAAEEVAQAAAEKGAPEQLPDGGEIVSESGSLLTLTANEALRYQMIPVVLDDLVAVKSYFELSGMPLKRVTPTWAEDLFRWLRDPMIAGLLLLLGFGGLYLEFQQPGFGAPGIIGLTALAIFFGSNMVLGLADWIDVTLVLVGIGLLAVEIFVLPGFGVAGIAGILALLAGLYLSLTRVPIPQYDWEVRMTSDALTSMATFMVTFGILLVASISLLPRSPFFRRLTLAEAQDISRGYTVQTAEEMSAAVGQVGEATSVLRPAGRGRFGDKTLDVVTRGEYIERGAKIRIIRAEGNRLEVEQVKE